MIVKKYNFIFYLALLLCFACERPKICDGKVSDAKGEYSVTYTKYEYWDGEWEIEDNKNILLTISGKKTTSAIVNGDVVSCFYEGL